MHDTMTSQTLQKLGNMLAIHIYILMSHSKLVTSCHDAWSWHWRNVVTLWSFNIITSSTENYEIWFYVYYSNVSMNYYYNNNSSSLTQTVEDFSIESHSRARSFASLLMYVTLSMEKWLLQRRFLCCFHSFHGQQIHIYTFATLGLSRLTFTFKLGHS